MVCPAGHSRRADRPQLEVADVFRRYGHGLPPAGHRYVRVANDILLIAAGTGMVIDAIEDLGKM